MSTDIDLRSVLIGRHQDIYVSTHCRTSKASIDFVLDTVQRMVDQPKKYASEDAEKYVKDEDYKDLMLWYKEFYPELFEFGNLKTRIELYSIAHDLEDLENWPDVQRLKHSLKRITKRAL